VQVSKLLRVLQSLHTENTDCKRQLLLLRSELKVVKAENRKLRAGAGIQPVRQTPTSAWPMRTGPTAASPPPEETQLSSAEEFLLQQLTHVMDGVLPVSPESRQEAHLTR